MEKKLLTGKNIIVTGTARGLGKTLVEVLADNGANVIALARIETDEHKEYCETIAKEKDVSITPLYLEMTDTEKMKEVVKSIKGYKKPIDGLVNNAGIAGNTLFQMTSMKELREIFEVDFFAPYLFTQYISKLMVRQGKGSIVNISSTSALDGNSGKSAYGSAKAALCTLTKSIAEELGGNGIRANVICPGMMETEMINSMPEYVIEIEKNATFIGRLAKTESIANTVVFLLSDSSKYITGQIIRVDGGKTLYDKRKA